MKHHDVAARTTKAVLSQLNAEIKAHGLTVKGLALELGEDYNTYRRWTTGEREMPMSVLWASTAALEISPEVFLLRVNDRLQND